MTTLTLDIASRARVASLLYKLAIRMQRASKRPLDPKKSSQHIDSVLGGALSRLGSNFSPPSSIIRGRPPAPLESWVPSIVKASGHRTFVPGHGPGIRLDLFFGPLHLVETVEGLGILTSSTEKDSTSRTGFGGKLETVDSAESLFISTLGGMSPKIKVVTSDVREVSDTRFQIARDFQDGKRVWKILDRQTGKPAAYEDISAVNSRDVSTHDLYRDAIFTSAQEATKVLNELTRGLKSKGRVLPKFKERLMYVRYSSSYLKNSPASQVGSGLFDALETFFPEETQSRSESAEQRMKMFEESRNQKNRQEEDAAKEVADTQRQRWFKDMARR